jgi:hypothetical protein
LWKYFTYKSAWWVYFPVKCQYRHEFIFYIASRADCILPNPDWVSWHPAFRKEYQFSAISSSLLDQSNGLLDCSLEIKPARFVLSNSSSDGRHNKFFFAQGETRFFLCCFNEQGIGGIYTFSLLFRRQTGSTVISSISNLYLSPGFSCV